MGLGEENAFEIITWLLFTCKFVSSWELDYESDCKEEVSSLRSCLESGLSKGPRVASKGLQTGLDPYRVAELQKPDLSFPKRFFNYLPLLLGKCLHH